MRNWFGYGLGSTLVLFGAFAIGGTIHQAFVRNAFPAASFPTALGLSVGMALVVVGYGVERRYEDGLEPEARDDRGHDRAKGGNENSFDESEAPFDPADMSKYDRDDG
jgi:hypothetical protein